MLVQLFCMHFRKYLSNGVARVRALGVVCLTGQNRMRGNLFDVGLGKVTNQKATEGNNCLMLHKKRQVRRGW